MKSLPARPHHLAAALAAVLSVALMAPSAGSAAPADGTATIKARPGKATTNLFALGAELRGPGKGGPKEAALPVVSVDLGKVVSVWTGRGVAIVRGQRRVAIRGLVFRLRARSTVVAGIVGARKVNVFRAYGRRIHLADEVSLGRASLALTPAGARALAPKLGIRRLRPGRLGELTLNALRNETVKPSAPQPQPEPEPEPEPEPQQEPEPQPDPYPFAAQCPVEPVDGPSFGDAPAPVPAPAPGPTLGAMAQEVVGTTIEWGFLQSFRNYVLVVPPQGSLQALDGATASAGGPGMAAPDAFFGFPVSDGSYEAGAVADHTDDRLIADAGGTALFCKSGHGFSYAIRNPTVVFDGEGSRLVAEVGTNQHGVWHDFQRTDIADLDLDAATIALADGGNTVVWSDVPATLTASGEAALGGIYKAGQALDAVTVRASLERPLPDQCSVDSGAGEPASVDFALAPLPDLDAPLVVNGEGEAVGTINWGFRPSLRSSVASFGSFPLLGGATAAFADMGGSSTKPVSEGGGIGKFFRFPVSRYAYDEGTSAPEDDRLIAGSDATVAFCNPTHGYGLAISKPTLILDAGDSRLVANAYSWVKGGGWIGGRVDLVALDGSTADPVAEAGAVRWGDIPADENPLVEGISVTESLTSALGRANVSEGLAAGWDPVAVQITLPDG